MTKAKTQPLPRLCYTYQEVAELLRVDYQTIAAYVKQGKLKAVRLPGGRPRILTTEIDYLLSDTGRPSHLQMYALEEAKNG